MPASCTRAQNGSNRGSAGERSPSGVKTGPLRMVTTRAPLSRHHSSSVRAWPRSDRVRNGHGEDPLVVGVAPVLVEPAVEGAQHLDGGLDVRLHGAFHADALGREQPRCFDALDVHTREAGIVVEPLRMRGGVLAGQLVADPLLAALSGEVVVERPRAGAGMDVARAGDDRVGPLAEEVAGLAVGDPQNDTAVGELGVAVAGKGVADLPVVVVGVEDGPRCRSRGWTCVPPQSVPWRSSLPGVASVHSPSMNVVSPFTMIRS